MMGDPESQTTRKSYLTGSRRTDTLNAGGVNQLMLLDPYFGQGLRM
jgi:hypothetical protein